MTATSLWYERAGVVGLRVTELAAPGAGFARVRTLFSGISRGTERLVLAGAVPREEWSRMRAPLQEGDFPFRSNMAMPRSASSRQAPPR